MRRLHNTQAQLTASHCRLTRESDCSLMHSKVYSDWLPCYIKATRPVLKIFKMEETFRTAAFVRTYACIRNGTSSSCIHCVHGMATRPGVHHTSTSTLGACNLKYPLFPVSNDVSVGYTLPFT